MKGEQLLQEPSFAKDLAKSPFKAEDLPGLSSSIADVFGRLSPQQREVVKNGMADLEAMSKDQLLSLDRLLAYLEKNQDQYPELIQQLVSSGAFDTEDVPKDYDPRFVAIARALIGQTLLKKSGERGYAEGGIVSLKEAANRVSAAGRNGDTTLAHVTPFEMTMLKRMGGSGTVNPKTGLLEFGLFGSILKTVGTILGSVILTPFVGPIAAGAISSGAVSLLSGAKPADALKSALIGGAMSGISAGFTGSGSFTENAFAGGSLFGSGPASSPLGDWISKNIPGTSGFLSGNLTGDAASSAAGIGPESAAAEWTKDIPMPVARPGAEEAAALAAAQTSGNAATGVAPTVSASSSGGIGSLMNSAKGFFNDYKLPLLIAGGAGLLALSNSEKENPQPSLVSKTTSDDLIKADPARYAFDIKNFRPRYTSGPTQVSPVGGYLTSPTGFRYDQFPGGGVMNARVGGPINGPGTGTSDSIPARLSDGEFVMTAAAVRGAGGGNRKAGAKKMYDLMHKFERMA